MFGRGRVVPFATRREPAMPDQFDPKDLTDLRSIMYLLQQICDLNAPGHRGAELRIDTSEGRKLVLPVWPWRPPPPSESGR
jgi:hypothetical protein